MEGSYFKEYKRIEDGVNSNFLILEVEGDVVNTLDLRNAIEKLEFPGLGISAILPLFEMVMPLK